MEEKLERIPKVVRASGVPADDGFLKGASSLIVPANTKATVLVDQTYLTTAYPELMVSGGNGSTVAIRYAEALFNKAGKKETATKPKAKSWWVLTTSTCPMVRRIACFVPLWFRTYRYVQLEIQTAGTPLTLHDFPDGSPLIRSNKKPVSPAAIRC